MDFTSLGIIETSLVNTYTEHFELWDDLNVTSKNDMYSFLQQRDSLTQLSAMIKRLKL